MVEQNDMSDEKKQEGMTPGKPEATTENPETPETELNEVIEKVQEATEMSKDVQEDTAKLEEKTSYIDNPETAKEIEEEISKTEEERREAVEFFTRTVTGIPLNIENGEASITGGEFQEKTEQAIESEEGGTTNPENTAGTEGVDDTTEEPKETAAGEGNTEVKEPSEEDIITFLKEILEKAPIDSEEYEEMLVLMEEFKEKDILEKENIIKEFKKTYRGELGIVEEDPEKLKELLDERQNKIVEELKEDNSEGEPTDRQKELIKKQDEFLEILNGNENIFELKNKEDIKKVNEYFKELGNRFQNLADWLKCDYLNSGEDLGESHMQKRLSIERLQALADLIKGGLYDESTGELLLDEVGIKKASKLLELLKYLLPAGVIAALAKALAMLAGKFGGDKGLTAVMSVLTTDVAWKLGKIAGSTTAGKIIFGGGLITLLYAITDEKQRDNFMKKICGVSIPFGLGASESK
ncbi:MAG: hypothetical protein PHI66_00975 [Candidatus Pacebacteria bacterium]|nr:hypothetical protein [Candidatus Paceibacterota bacterium]